MYADRYRRPEALRSATSRIHFQTTLNLSRYIYAQNFKLRTRTDRTPRFAAEPSLAVFPDPNLYSEEWPLSPATNLVIGPWAKYAYAKSRATSQHFSDYVGLLEHHIEQAMLEASPSDDFHFQREPFYSIQEIEIYWEFECKNPILFVDELIPRVRRLGRTSYEGSLSTQLRSRPSENITQQSNSIKAKIAEGTWLKVYAKTTRRIRIELEIKSEMISKITGRRSEHGLADAARKIPSLEDYATDKINTVLPDILSSTTPETNATAIDLLTQIASACEKPHECEGIVGSLAAYGRISLYDGTLLSVPTHKLKKRGILKTATPRSRIYVVEPKFEKALAHLRKLL
ncbi:hypothetical protein LCM28_05535 [Salipiger pacificus]|nr:hypothetical protein [Alloyangia pacifica]